MTWGFDLDTVENYAWMDGVFTPDECQKIKEIAAAKNTKKDAVINGDDAGPGNKVNPKIRKNKVVWLEPQDDLDWAYRKMTDAVMRLNEQFFKFELWGFTEQVQFTEYNAPGDHYLQHIDKIYNGTIRKLSIVIQLTDPDEYEGCELQLFTQTKPEIMRKTQGTMLAFPSYTLHQVTPITKGQRHTIVAWLGGKPFK
jgi:PKHD-type hydroxylase